MATVQKYRLSDGPPGYVKYADWVMTIEYGICEYGERASRELWFVKISHGIKVDDRDHLRLHKEYILANNSGHFSPFEGSFPFETHTFFVEARYASRYWFNELRRDIDAWKEVCTDFIVGDWDTHYERLWRDNPVFQHMLPDKTVVQVGYSPVQSTNYPHRELWFVIFPGPHGFIVDREAASAAFINAVGSNYLDWIKLCWCHLEHESDWLLLGNHNIALDSPWSVEDIDISLAEYRQKITNSTSRQRPTGKKRWWIF